MESDSSEVDKLRPYFGRELKQLTYVGADIRENKSVAYRIFAVIYMSSFLLYPIICLSDLFKYDFDVVADLMIYEASSLMANTEFIVLLFNKAKVVKLLKTLEEPPFKPNAERGGIAEENLLKRCIRITRAQATVCWFSVVLTVSLATSFTLKKRILSSDPNDWEFTYGPITLLNVSYSPNYEITYIYQGIATTTIGFNHSTANLLMAGILAHVSTQFKMLQNNLHRIVENAYRMMLKDTQGEDAEISEKEIDTSKIPWKYLQKSLKSTVIYHQSILDIATAMGDIFGFLMLSIFMFTLLVQCFLVYHASVLEINDMRMVKTFTDSSTAVFPVLLLCFWSQEVVHESEQVAVAASHANFPGSDLRFQKSLNLIICRGQRPMQLKAGHLVDISLATFVSFTKTSYSAFMVLRKANTAELTE